MQELTRDGPFLPIAPISVVVASSIRLCFAKGYTFLYSGHFTLNFFKLLIMRYAQLSYTVT